jgi:hypothetical protein
MLLEEFIEPSLSELIFSSYDGDIDEDSGCYQGMGSAVIDNGCTYVGNFMKGMMHGQGKFVWPNGVEYEGDFVNGKVGAQQCNHNTCNCT